MKLRKLLSGTTFIVGLAAFVLFPWSPTSWAGTITFTGYPTYWLGPTSSYHLARPGAISGAGSANPRTVEAASAELTFDPVNGGQVKGKLVLTVSGLSTLCKFTPKGPVTFQYVREFTGTYDPDTGNMDGTAVLKTNLLTDPDPGDSTCPDPGPKPELTDYIWQIRFTYPAGLVDDELLDPAPADHEHQPFKTPANPEHGGIISIWGIPNFGEGKPGVLAVVWDLEATGCDVSDVEGWFEPCQGVFQDDYTFADKPGKQLTQLSPNRYRAELDMVKGRPTRLVGVRGPNAKVAAGGATIVDPNRDRIIIRGKSSGTKEVDAQFCFFVEQGSSRREIFRSEEVYKVPLGRPCGGEPREFEVSLNVPAGIPAPPQSPYFIFQRKGDYRIVGELVRLDGKPTLVDVTVEGQVIETQPLEVHFVPVVISNDALTKSGVLKTFTDDLADHAGARIPDFFPLTQADFKAVKHPVQDLRASLVEWVFTERRVRAKLTDMMRSGGILSNANRVIAVLSEDDFERVAGLGDPFNGIHARTSSEKVVFLKYDTSPSVDELTFTVAHELIHTLPYVEPEVWMKGTCGVDFHNVEGLADKVSPADRVAHGHEITFKGSAAGARGVLMRKRLPVMGQSSSQKWISQCTYRHLLDELSKPLSDPEVVLVRGLIDRSEVPFQGRLFPAYQLEGVLDLEAGSGGDWAIIMRDAAGDELSRLPFAPEFYVTDPDEQVDLTSFGYRVAALPEATRIDLVGPGDALLDSISYSASAPSLAIITPLDGNDAVLEPTGTAHLEWAGHDADGDSLLYSVLYSAASPWSSNNIWQTLSFEQTETAFDLAVDQTHYRYYPHRVRVIATDGTQSTVEETEFNLVRLLDHATAMSVDIDTSRPVFRLDEFLTTDEQVTSWLKVGPLSTAHEVEWNWYSPQGDLYAYHGPVILGQAGQSFDSWTAWAQIAIAGSDASLLPGRWTVEVLLNGRPLVTEEFTIRAP